MKFIHRLSLFVVVALVSLPLVIMAQDIRQQPSVPTPVELTEDDLVPIPPKPPVPTLTDDELVPPFVPSPTLDIQPARTATLELYDYPTATLDIHLAQTATLELYDYPTTAPGDPCVDENGNRIHSSACDPTMTPLPRPTNQPTTAIVNGLWVLDPKGSTYDHSGQCQIEGGDNGGPDGNGDDIEDLPKVPVCMTSDNQWLSVDSGSMYPLVIANYYSQQEMSRELVTTNGKTSGSVNINTTRQYHVVSPSEIQFSYIRKEQGGCTTNSTVTYRLIQADETVCHAAVVMTPNYTAVPTQMPTPKPGETQQPPVTPEPPIQIGEYTIQLPPVDAICGADKMPPSSTVNLNYDNNQNMFINFGSLSYTLFWNGSDTYDYQEGNQFSISLNTYAGGASLSWSNHGCFVNSQLAGPGLPATAAPVAGEPTLQPTMDVAAIAGNSYSVSADSPAYMCAENNKAMLPDLNGAALSAQADNSFTFSVGGKDYTLTNYGGVASYVETKEDGGIFTITMNGFTDGVGSGTILALNADGSKTCMAVLTFKPQ